MIDPMLSPAGAMSAAANAANACPNPTVNLNMNVSGLLAADAVLLTHAHRDHFDSVAAALLSKDVPFFCQPEDVETIRSQGFTKVEAIQHEKTWSQIRFIRTGGQHGTGELGKAMGPVSGFVLKAEGEPSLYIAGDTVWCDEVEQALTLHHPDVIVVFAGAAQFLQGGPLTMTEHDIAKVCLTSPHSTIIAAHMEAWNHCLLRREDLASYLEAHHLQDRVFIPHDGDSFEFR